MTTPSRQRLREWSAALTLGPLDPADPKETRYVALAEAGRAAVDELMATIELAFDTTTQCQCPKSSARLSWGFAVACRGVRTSAMY
ncbi:MAG: hypothetical protein JO272_18350 [Pseudonocardiales bacterium]|nr:hypothetical protein [Pseudonocardiales bacterium]